MNICEQLFSKLCMCKIRWVAWAQLWVQEQPSSPFDLWANWVHSFSICSFTRNWYVQGVGRCTVNCGGAWISNTSDGHGKVLSYKTGMTKITQGFSAKYRALTPKYINNSLIRHPTVGHSASCSLGTMSSLLCAINVLLLMKHRVGVSASVTFIITYMHYSSYYYSRLTLFLTV